MPSVRTAVASCTRPRRIASVRKVRPWWSASTVAFIVFVLLLARDERPSAAPSRAWPPDVDLGGLQPQLHTLGVGVGEDVRRSTPGRFGTAYPRSAGRVRIWPAAWVRSGAAHPEQQAQDRVRQVMAQVAQSGHQAVDEDQAAPDARPSGPFP